MAQHAYTDVPVVGYVDEASGLLIVAALLDGVEVPLAVHKHGHFAGLLDEAAANKRQASDEQAAASSSSSSAPGTPSEYLGATSSTSSSSVTEGSTAHAPPSA